MVDVLHLKQLYDHQKNSGQRGTIQSYWEETADYVLPSHSDFWTTAAATTRGRKKNQKVYDTTAPLALGHFQSLLESLVCPRHTRWHGLQTTDFRVNENPSNREWFQYATDVMFMNRYRASSNWQSQIAENFMSIGAFGNGVMYIGVGPDGRPRYKTCFIGDCYPALDQYGMLDTMFYRFDYTHKQAFERWGKQIPDEVAAQLEQNPLETTSYVHAVFQNPDQTSPLKYLSVYFHEGEGIQLKDRPDLKEEGFRTMPYVFGRYLTAPYEVLGRGPAMEMLPTIRSLNEMAWADLRATHKLVDPPLLAHDDSMLGMGRSEILLDPGEITYGGVNAEGRQLIQPLQTGARVDINEEKMNKQRSDIREAFMVNLFQILVETPRMTATEVLHRAQEKGALIGPVMGRIQSEQIGPIIKRELDILMANGIIEPPPAEVQAKLDAGELDIIYESPLSRLQRMEELTGIDTMIQMAVSLQNAGNQEAGMVLDALNIMDIVAKGSGAPVAAVRPREEVEAQLEAQAEAQRAEVGMMEAQRAGQAAQGMKNLAQAAEIRRGI